ncbi:MAG TPA: TonB-dependent receptor plug domain-containing protein, partial [Polyangiaceae bacterium]|nr:TonB-dependent receptor plug domain-containing protein [Polyangiaceae bacterium]
VVEVPVTEPAGHGLDEAAVAAVRRFVFEPARRGGPGGLAVPATVQLAYEFTLPKAAPPPPAPPPPRPPAKAAVEPTLADPGQSTLVLGQRPMSAASARSVRDRDFRLRPVGTVADILRVTPGLLVVQHAGGGKANQYFLRGFDADHGTDIAFSLDGVPINMVSHGHGQGYSDTNFIIPETVERIEITKGPYFAEQGNFATAGSVNLVTRSDFEHSSFGFGGGGSPGRGGPALRGLLIASPKLESMRPLFAAELGRSDGPFQNPERFSRYKVFSKVSWDIAPASSASIGLSSYAGDWFGSGQIARREVNAGRLDRFGYHDPTEGGASARHQAFAALKVRPTEKSELTASAYVGQYRFNLYSNFTLFRDDAAQGDAILQTDRRTFYGGQASYRVVHDLAPLRFDTTMGTNVRSDAIRNQLDHQRARQVLDTRRSHSIQETALGAYGKEEVALARWLRVIGSARADFFSFAVDDAREVGGAAGGATSGVKGASQLSPKASVVVSPLEQRAARLDVYANYGHGFHSNDARGVVLGQGGVTPLTRAIGSEVGARARLFERWELAASLWQLDLASETVWIGDEGTTEAGDPTHRFGGELETRLDLTSWLSLDLDLTATKSRLTQNAGNGDAVALAPRFTWAGGVSARHPSGLRGGLRFYGVGDRPATQDYPAPGSLVAEGFSVFDLHLGYRHRRFDVAFDVENLFNAAYNSAQFATTSRLATEPPIGAPPPSGACGNGSRVSAAEGGGFGGCEDIHFTPGYPLTLRLMTTVYLD